MKTFAKTLAFPALVPGTVFTIGWQVHAETNRVKFPELEGLVHYTTVRRGNVMEHIMTTPETMAAVKAGQPIPQGTHFVLVDYRDGELYRYFVMERAKGSASIMTPAAAPQTGSSSGSGRTSRSIWTRTPPVVSPVTAAKRIAISSTRPTVFPDVAGFFVHCAAIAGLYMFLTYYAMQWLQRRKRRAIAT